MKKLLFTPGPLSTSEAVKGAMLEDVGSRDRGFIETVSVIRNELLSLAHVSKGMGFECVIMQGSGTFGMESIITSALGKNDSLLVIANGAYGERILKMAEIHGIRHQVLRFPENEAADVNAVEAFLHHTDAAGSGSLTHVACVHCETTTGLFNDIERIGKICRAKNKKLIVDAMSSFGGTDIPVQEWNIAFLVSSSNKCMEGVPGFSFIIANHDELQKCKGQSRTLSLDLYEQWKGLETNGQFRFTPPTLSIMAFRQAIDELKKEGGVKAREARYRKNKAVLDEGMSRLGFKFYLPKEMQGHIITAFLYPDAHAFSFERFYRQLSDRGMVIYPGKLTRAHVFRIGTIGHIFPHDVRALVAAIEDVIAVQSQ